MSRWGIDISVMQPPDISAALLAAAALTKQGWVRRTWATHKKSNREVSPRHPDAGAWCANGAIIKATNCTVSMYQRQEYHKRWAPVAQVFACELSLDLGDTWETALAEPVAYIGDWNDFSGQSQASVTARLRSAAMGVVLAEIAQKYAAR